MPQISFTYRITDHEGARVEEPIPLIPAELSFAGHRLSSWLMLDTGSNGTCLHARSLAHIDSSITFTEDLRSIPGRIQIADIDVGWPLFIDREAILASTGDQPMSCGLIGYDFLHERILHIDFPGRLVDFDAAMPATHASDVAFDFYLDYYLVLHAQIGGEVYRFIYDSGIGTDILLFEQALEKYGHPTTPPVKVMQGHGVHGQSYLVEEYEPQQQVYFGKGLQLDTRMKVLRDSPMTATLQADGLIGNALFKNHEIFIDFVSKKFTCQPSVS